MTTRISLSTTGAQPNGASACPSCSADGRFVAFASSASNLVAGDSNGAYDIFVRDRATGTTERVSVDQSGSEAVGASWWPAISCDGRFVAFGSSASNLVPGDTNGTDDIFLKDRQTGRITRVSVDSAGNQCNAGARYAAISADGRRVSFFSNSSDLVAGDTNNTWDAFVHDRSTGTTLRVSVDSNGVEGNDVSGDARMSEDGRAVVFGSRATNLVTGDTNGAYDVFVRDMLAGTTTRVSVDSNGVEGNAGSGDARISADGRFVLFGSEATNLIPGGTSWIQVFLHDRQSGVTGLVSADAGGWQGSAVSEWGQLSADGRYAAFVSYAANLVPQDSNGWPDVFVRDIVLGQTRRVSLSSSGAQGNQRSGVDIHNSPSLCMSSNARFLCFGSEATNLVAGDTNGVLDIFAHDQFGTGFTSICDPGLGGVSGCPCANPPGSAGRGCNNSSATGGAVLSATGVAYLPQDSLLLSTSGEGPNALSVVIQGNAAIPGGMFLGQGVLCLGGAHVHRLYVAHAVNGSITKPDVGAGDLALSAASAAMGDVIQPGESRWYAVYYRDPLVLGGCPASSTFNTTQTGRIDWSF